MISGYLIFKFGSWGIFVLPIKIFIGMILGVFLLKILTVFNEEFIHFKPGKKSIAQKYSEAERETESRQPPVS